MNQVTLETLGKIQAHLITQKAQAISEGRAGACRLRTECGLKCAVGSIIPDELYDSSMEASSANTLRMRWPNLFDKDLDLGPIQLTLSYHDGVLFGSRSKRPEGYCYMKWIEGDVNHHPDLAFAAIREEYGIV
jgi:hypothetical protein